MMLELRMTCVLVVYAIALVGIEISRRRGRLSEQSHLRLSLIGAVLLGFPLMAVSLWGRPYDIAKWSLVWALIALGFSVPWLVWWGHVEHGDWRAGLMILCGIRTDDKSR